MPISDTWTCHVCGEERPDRLVGVQRYVNTQGSIPIKFNVRHCIDKAKCQRGARAVAERWAGGQVRHLG